jgi:TonB family protein
MPMILDPPPPAVVAAPAAPDVRPDWTRKPTGDDFARYYPERAQRMNVEGRGVIKCNVTITGDLTNCIVEQEAPASMGFGEAALKLGKLFRARPATKDGVPVEGATVTIPIVFRLPGVRTMSSAIRVVQDGVSEGYVNLECWVTKTQDLDKCAGIETDDAPQLRDIALKAAGHIAVPKEVASGTRFILRVHVTPTR